MKTEWPKSDFLRYSNLEREREKISDELRFLEISSEYFRFWQGELCT